MEVGDIVRTNLEHAWVWDGTEWEGKMSRERTGEIVEIPLFAETTGSGTIRVRWHSLTESPNDNDRNWLMWVHSDLIHIGAA